MKSLSSCLENPMFKSQDKVNTIRAFLQEHLDSHLDTSGHKSSRYNGSVLPNHSTEQDPRSRQNDISRSHINYLLESFVESLGVIYNKTKKNSVLSTTFQQELIKDLEILCDDFQRAKIIFSMHFSPELDSNLSHHAHSNPSQSQLLQTYNEYELYTQGIEGMKKNPSEAHNIINEINREYQQQNNILRCGQDKLIFTFPARENQESGQNVLMQQEIPRTIIYPSMNQQSWGFDRDDFQNIDRLLSQTVNHYNNFFEYAFDPESYVIKSSEVSQGVCNPHLSQTSSASTKQILSCDNNLLESMRKIKSMNNLKDIDPNSPHIPTNQTEFGLELPQKIEVKQQCNVKHKSRKLNPNANLYNSIIPFKSYLNLDFGILFQTLLDMIEKWCLTYAYEPNVYNDTQISAQNSLLWNYMISCVSTEDREVNEKRVKDFMNHTSTRYLFAMKMMTTYIFENMLSLSNFYGFNEDTTEKLVEFMDKMGEKGITMVDRQNLIDQRDSAIKAILNHKDYNSWRSNKLKQHVAYLRDILRQFLSENCDYTSAGRELGAITVKAFGIFSSIHRSGLAFKIIFPETTSKFNASTMIAHEQTCAQEYAQQTSMRRLKLAVTPLITILDYRGSVIKEKTLHLAKVLTVTSEDVEL
ncbi:BgTH12-06950 [Blumeria graminis f. sp. triticale]|uniref:Bgt-4481 n=3 Tax=Blumeria graminis TaxID=34373 RepID=A0A381L3Q4_BLUGR|nr:hypothetical protein BGT96224_4481 [Blumeria graminis f. sp. tritici 96224]CAD6506018.1 BgTH12-06950 [Blumeria graminis f. sp. triticale]VDB94656.1 Bgt-4481 [Blumeria graminis f. sp. tritici]